MGEAIWGFPQLCLICLGRCWRGTQGFWMLVLNGLWSLSEKAFSRAECGSHSQPGLLMRVNRKLVSFRPRSTNSTGVLIIAIMQLNGDRWFFVQTGTLFGRGKMNYASCSYKDFLNRYIIRRQLGYWCILKIQQWQPTVVNNVIDQDEHWGSGDANSGTIPIALQCFWGWQNFFKVYYFGK